LADVHDRERQLQREISHEVETALPGVEVLAVELSGRERFTVFIDAPGGVDHALCERVTQLLDGYRARYVSDVSSPGPGRPLRKQGHFARAVGQNVALRTAHEIHGKTKFKGQVVAAGGTALALAVGDGERLEIPYEQIVRGNLIEDR
jgi:ribosome maturation factor RimP